MGEERGGGGGGEREGGKRRSSKEWERGERDREKGINNSTKQFPLQCTCTTLTSGWGEREGGGMEIEKK